MAEVNDLIARIMDRDDKVRCAAWLGAAEYGATAVRPLVAVLGDDDPEVRRAARNALWTIVRHAGRPGAAAEREAVERELCGVVAAASRGAAGQGASAGSVQGPPSSAARRELFWMLSEIGGEAAVRAIGGIPGLLDAKDIREDARCALERIPLAAAVRALEEALAAAPEEFKPALAASLRARGVEVPGIPDHKLVPTKGTAVKPVTQESTTGS